MTRLRIDVWSDIACPWCYVGKRRLEAALTGFEHRDQVDVVWRSFELDPSAPRIQPVDGDYAGRLARKYRTSEAEAQGRIDQLVKVAAADGLDMRFDRIRPGNTFDAHRVLHLAHGGRRQDAVKERFMRGYFTDGAAIGDPAVVRELAVAAGLDGAEVDDVLATDRHADRVRADEALARELDIRGVPCFVFDRRLGVSGAQPADALRATMAEAWRTLEPAAAADRDREPAPADADGDACGPDGCT